MKVVIDINVLVSGSLWKGNSSRFVDPVLDGAATLCVSPVILAEPEEVIQRDKFRARLEERAQSPGALTAKFRAAALVVDGRSIPVPSSLRDPDDVHVPACALAAGADAIISGDDDLLSMKSFEGVAILNVRQALEKIGLPPD